MNIIVNCRSVAFVVKVFKAENFAASSVSPWPVADNVVTAILASAKEVTENGIIYISSFTPLLV